VAIVVVVFLQTWRASLIPLAAVPVSIIGTFAVMLVAGFAINTLTLFGLVLAVGIVVDDAIVVVENVERHIEEGLSPREASRVAMDEVSGPIIAIGLVLCAVFVPMAFISGLSGQFYRQFALTIAFSTVISAFNSLTLSPALAALLLRPRGATPDRLTRIIDAGAGWFFRPFNRGFIAAAQRYQESVRRLIRYKGAALVVYAGLVVVTVIVFRRVPPGFVPTQDKQYLIAVAQLPNGASLDRTDEVIHRMSEIGLAHPAMAHTFSITGLSINAFAGIPNAGAIFLVLKPFSERQGKGLYGLDVARTLNQQFGEIPGAFIGVFPPPAVSGLGPVGGFKLEIEDKAGLGEAALYQASQAVRFRAYQTPELVGVFSTFEVNVPQLFVDVDRAKAKREGVALRDLFETLQANLGSQYVNDFNKFGRTYQVIAQADAMHRATPEDITRLKVRNAYGTMVPVGAIATVQQTFGPDLVAHYNGLPAADLSGNAAPGVSSGQAQAALAKIATEVLPRGIGFEWTDLAYQQIIAGNTAAWVFPLSVLLAFLVLAAQYESWTLPLAVILIVPMSTLCALGGVLLTHGDKNVFVEVGLVVLLGLACKNAILIVQFAHERQLLAGADRVSAALDAARLRLRPILMTSFAFIMGVVPLVFATGAGAEMRHAMGVAVFSGMLGVSVFGLFLTPVFFVTLRAIAERRPPHAATQVPDPTPRTISLVQGAGD